jgi:hypothetical protein
VVDGKSNSNFGGAKYMCNDIIQIIIPKKSCSKVTKKKKKIINHVNTHWHEI